MFWLIPFVVLAVVLAATVALLLSLQRQVRIQTGRQGRRIDQILARLEIAPTPALVNPRAGFNRIHRVEALRLLRRG